MQDTEITRLKNRLALLEKKRSELFYRFARNLPKNWEGKSVRNLIEGGFGKEMSNFLTEVLNWMSEEAYGNRPQVPNAPAFSEITGQSKPESQMLVEAPMTGMLR